MREPHHFYQQQKKNMLCLHNIRMKPCTYPYVNTACMHCMAVLAHVLVPVSSSACYVFTFPPRYTYVCIYIHMRAPAWHPNKNEQGAHSSDQLRIVDPRPHWKPPKYKEKREKKREKKEWKPYPKANGMLKPYNMYVCTLQQQLRCSQGARLSAVFQS